MCDSVYSGRWLYCFDKNSLRLHICLQYITFSHTCGFYTFLLFFWNNILDWISLFLCVFSLSPAQLYVQLWLTQVVNMLFNKLLQLLFFTFSFSPLWVYLFTFSSFAFSCLPFPIKLFCCLLPAWARQGWDGRKEGGVECIWMIWYAVTAFCFIAGAFALSP